MSGNSSSSGSINYPDSEDLRTHGKGGFNASDYSSDGTNSIGSYGMWSDHYSGASTDSGRSDSSSSGNSAWSNYSGSSATSWGSASTWGQVHGRGTEEGYDGDTESICQWFYILLNVKIENWIYMHWIGQQHVWRTTVLTIFQLLLGLPFGGNALNIPDINDIPRNQS